MLHLQDELFYQKYKDFLNEAKTSDKQDKTLKDKIISGLEANEIFVDLENFEENPKEKTVNFNLKMSLDNNTSISFYYLFNKNNIDVELSVISEENKEKIPVSIPLNDQFIDDLNKVYAFLNETLPKLLPEFF